MVQGTRRLRTEVSGSIKIQNMTRCTNSGLVLYGDRLRCCCLMPTQVMNLRFEPATLPYSMFYY